MQKFHAKMDLFFHWDKIVKENFELSLLKGFLQRVCSLLWLSMRNLQRTE